MNDNPEPEVRFSRNFRRTEGRKRRRSALLGAVLGLIASLLFLADGVSAWLGHGMVDMGPRMGFAKYPPTLVIAMGMIGLGLCAYGLWSVLTDRSESQAGK